MKRTIVILGLVAAFAGADGKVVPPRDYKGSLEERAQEAVIVFQGSEELGGALEDLVLKITVAGAAKDFAWVVPFPSEPKIRKADAKIFKELFDYVQARGSRKRKGKLGTGAEAEGPKQSVEVLQRRIVGSYDVAVVRERTAGTLNGWLEKNGYRSLGGAEDVLGFYRKKGYVYACLKVKDVALEEDKPVDLHPLRFTFKPGGRDAIYFPMRLTGLQSEPFDVNLYVFHRYWLNDRLNQYGYAHRGFRLRYRDWDSPKCKANGGKGWADPKADPFLASMARRIPAVTALLQSIRPGARYYMTNVQGRFKPNDVRGWRDDLWLFPYYTNRDFVPHDARKGGCAADAYGGS